MVGYLAVTLIVNLCRFGTLLHDRKELIGHIFDASMFAGSALLMAGIVDKSVLILLGNTKPFLLIASLAGVLYSIKEIMPPRR